MAIPRRFLAKPKRAPRASDGVEGLPRKRRKVELPIQQAIIAYVKMAVPGCDVRAIPMASKDEGERLERWKEGARAGTPDIVCILPGGLTVWLETKSEAGSLSKDQRETRKVWLALGHHVFTVRSIEDAEDALLGLGVALRARTNLARVEASTVPL